MANSCVSIREFGAISDGWIKVTRVYPTQATPVNPDAGEASTLGLTIDRADSDLVLMDEMLGGSHARALGLDVTGLLGIMLAAKSAGLVHGERPFFERRARSHFRLSEESVLTIMEGEGKS